MKKYLMTGITALAMSGLFTSCTHDMDNYVGDTTKQIKQNYENAFVDHFGTPASDQDWGFGTKTTAAARAMTRSLPEKPSFRDTNPIEKPVMPNYSNTVPDGAKYATETINNGDVMYIDEAYTKNHGEWEPYNLDGKSDLTIYIDGNVTFHGSTYQDGNGTMVCVTEGSTLKLKGIRNGLKVYLAPNAKLDLSLIEWATFQNSNAALYMNSGSKIINAKNLSFVNNVIILNEGGTINAENLTLNSATLWNAGTVSVTKQLGTSNNAAFIINEAGKTITAGNLLMNNNNDLLYNNGTVDIDGNIKLKNTAAEIINNNNLECTSLDMEAGAKFHNVGTVNMTGKTYVYNTNSRWMNDGQYTCGEFELDGGIDPAFVYNNCKLTVNGNFHQNHGAFALDAGASVICESFTWDHDGYFYMGSKSLLKVNGDLLARNYNSGGYGFRGEGDDYAVIQAGSIKKETEGQYRAAYYGNIFIDTNNHFAQGGTDAQPWYYFDSSVKFSFNDNSTSTVKKATKAENFYINIPADNTNGCTPGYTWGTSADKTETIRVIAEDLTINDVNADFDFNDVVFDVIWNKTQNTVKVELLAAGGELTIYVGGDASGVSKVQSVNEYFTMVNPDKGITEKTMINTYGGKHKEYKTYTYVLENDWWSGDNIGDIAKSIYIRVMKSGELMTLTADQGKAASKIAVGTDYEWCDERQDIDAKYNEKFSQFVGGAYSWNTWYK